MAAEGESINKARMQIHYVKSPDYREMSCHGAIGGQTPAAGTKGIWMALFAERTPIPRLVEYEVNVEGGRVRLDESAVTPVSIDTRDGLIRHVEFCAYLDLPAALRLREWLESQIVNLQNPE
jgi:hypothetical protein